MLSCSLSVIIRSLLNYLELPNLLKLTTLNLAWRTELQRALQNYLAMEYHRCADSLTWTQACICFRATRYLQQTISKNEDKFTSSANAVRRFYCQLVRLPFAWSEAVWFRLVREAKVQVATRTGHTLLIPFELLASVIYCRQEPPSAEVTLELDQYDSSYTYMMPIVCNQPPPPALLTRSTMIATTQPWVIEGLKDVGLTSLFLCFAQLTQPPNLQSFTNLQQLGLSNNNLTDLDLNLNLRLTLLNLSNNRIENINPSWLTASALILDGNPLKPQQLEVPELQFTTQILHLNRCGLTEIPPWLLRRDLAQLQLNDNQLSGHLTIPVSFQCTSLNNNHLTSATLVADTSGMMRSVQLNNNQLTSFNIQVAKAATRKIFSPWDLRIVNKVYIHDLHLSQNPLTTLGPFENIVIIFLHIDPDVTVQAGEQKIIINPPVKMIEEYDWIKKILSVTGDLRLDRRRSERSDR